AGPAWRPRRSPPAACRHRGRRRPRELADRYTLRTQRPRASTRMTCPSAHDGISRRAGDSTRRRCQMLATALGGGLAVPLAGGGGLARGLLALPGPLGPRRLAGGLRARPGSTARRRFVRL